MLFISIFEIFNNSILVMNLSTALSLFSECMQLQIICEHLHLDSIKIVNLFLSTENSYVNTYILNTYVQNEPRTHVFTIQLESMHP
jgi:hypothetical protein